MSKIHYLVGDATEPVLNPGKVNVIVHCCNNIGAWGAGFVIPLAKKHPKAKIVYTDFVTKAKKENPNYYDEIMGEVIYHYVDKSLVVANLIGQSGIYSDSIIGSVPIRYNAIEDGFKKILGKYGRNNLVVHCPRIGAGLAGGDWGKIESLLNKCFGDENVDVFVYDLKHEVFANKWKGTTYENI